MIKKASIFLLDTHAFVGYSQRGGISESLFNTLESSRIRKELFVSSVSFWELALLVKKRRIDLDDVESWIEETLTASGIQVIQPTLSELVGSTKLPDHHNDPFDRVLIAQACSRDMRLVTKDRYMKSYKVPIFWK